MTFFEIIAILAMGLLYVLVVTGSIAYIIESYFKHKTQFYNATERRRKLD